MSRPYEHHGITREEMCVIERRADGTLQTAYHPISYDHQLLGRLRELSEKTKSEEREQTAKLLEGVAPILENVVGVQGTDVASIAAHYRDVALDVYRSLGVTVDYSAYFPETSHDGWHYPTGPHFLPPYSRITREFNVPRQAVEACKPRLEEPAYRELEWAYRQATALRPHLMAALDGYERTFRTYVEEANRIYPGIFEPKSFCRNFSATYGEAVLDYAITPGNQCVVERVGEYYWACVLERLYGVYDRRRNVVAYSHRRRGFSNYKLTLAPRCDLKLLQETNFGYGSVRYFWTTLSYKGVSAINAPFLIFFHGAGKVRFSEHTFNYEVEEESFEACFNDAVRIHSEYREMGEADFVDKYFRKSLADLSSLLTIVANTDTFLQITTLERFDALTSGSTNALIPNGGFESMSFELTPYEERVCDDIVKAILSIRGAWDVERIAMNPRICELLDKAFGRYESTGLQLIVKKDLVRSYIVKELAPAVSGRRDVGELAKKLIAPDDGIFVETFEGYDLISMRVDKALSAIRPIKRLRKIATLTRFESVIDSIVSTCQQIGSQAQSYISRSIDPELGRMVPERNRLKSQLDATSAEIEKAKYGGIPVPAWLARQSQGLKTQIRSLDGAIAKLEQQKRKLTDYIRTVNSIRTAG